LERDFQSFAEIVELDSNIMHAVMMTSSPPLLYWEPQSIRLMKLVGNWRAHGIPVCYTLDAGANVHLLCLEEAGEKVQLLLNQLPFVQHVITAYPGCGARITDSCTS